MNSLNMSNSADWVMPLINALKDLGGSGRPKEVSTKIAETLNLPESVTNELLPSGALKFHNRIAWTRNYLAREGVLDATIRGVWVLTEKGWSTSYTAIQAREMVDKWLNVYKKNRESHITENECNISVLVNSTEEEPIPAEDDLLSILRGMSAKAFEHVCARLLRESGFENVTVTGRSHDGGIDGEGLLAINPFLTLKVVFQCKRYKGTVSREQVSDFENRTFKTADKGIFITTGYFSVDAMKEAQSGGKRQIELIDGERLVEMFKEVKLGVRPIVVYEVIPGFFKQFEE
ncbi:MAG: restriction endonuclease [Clostridiales bacterium]|jgi:restriction system protein|nr:restriction endonuclease [Clostridiales bacterium]